MVIYLDLFPQGLRLPENVESGFQLTLLLEDFTF